MTKKPRANFDTATPYIAAFVIIRRSDKIAFVLRENCSWMNGFYGLPSGKVEKNESFTAASVREAKEEVGVQLSENDLVYLHTMHRKSEDSEWVDIYFEAIHWEGEVVNAEPHMHSEVAWLDINNLPENVIPPLKLALEEIAKGNQYSEYGWRPL